MDCFDVSNREDCFEVITGWETIVSRLSLCWFGFNWMGIFEGTSGKHASNCPNVIFSSSLFKLTFNSTTLIAGLPFGFETIFKPDGNDAIVIVGDGDEDNNIAAEVGDGGEPADVDNKSLLLVDLVIIFCASAICAIINTNDDFSYTNVILKINKY